MLLQSDQSSQQKLNLVANVLEASLARGGRQFVLTANGVFWFS